MQPVTPFRRVDDYHRNLPSFRIKYVIFLRKRLDVRHGARALGAEKLAAWRSGSTA
jgi:hypothetical protein